MKKEEYINLVIDRINNNRARAMVRRELEDHIDDRIEYYTDAGYDYEYASKAAIEKMGKPENVAAEMDKLYSSRGDILIKCFLAVSYCLCALSIPFKKLNFFSVNEMLSFSQELIVVVTILISLRIARKRYRKNLALFQPLILIAVALPYCINGTLASPTVFFIEGLFKGKLKLYCMVEFLFEASINGYSKFVVVGTYAFYLSIILFSVANAFFISRNIKKYNARNEKKQMLLCTVLSLLIVLPIVLSMCAAVYFHLDSDSELIIYESNTKCEISEVPDCDKTALGIQLMHPYPFADVYVEDIFSEFESPRRYEEYCESTRLASSQMGLIGEIESIAHNKIDFKPMINRMKFEPNKKYVKLVMINLNSRETEWLEADGLVYYEPIKYNDLITGYIQIEFAKP